MRSSTLSAALLGSLFISAIVAVAGDKQPPRLLSLDPERDAPPEKTPFRIRLDDAVDENHVVLLVRDDVVGAFALSDTYPDQPATKARWIFRKGVEGPFHAKAAGTTAGGDWVTRDEGFRILFGPFDVGWRVAAGRAAEFDLPADGKTALCVTTAKEFEGLDPSRPDRVYLRHPGDSGASFAADRSSVRRRRRLVAVDASAPARPTTSGGCTERFRDKTIVLLAAGLRRAAVMITGRREVGTPSTGQSSIVQYEWWLRRDGIGKLDDAADVDHGTGESTSLGCVVGGICVGVGGEVQVEGLNQFAYRSGPNRGDRDDVFICVTNLVDVKGLDALDPKWLYKRSGADPGSRFESADAVK
jgi:hypothetical protein